ncbi:MAG: NHLP family bacteriocin export ABC transporter peptidase/permease/ATPase subunit [bacterium]|nr:NHLP family bacteriocin export ABC transporter peptidase/permease/ATPase subunit [bacterium]
MPIGSLRPWHKKAPTILQLEAVECGAASLAMVLAYHGRYEPLESLRAMCGVSRDGIKATNILKAARSFGFEAKGFKKEPEELAGLPLPQIVFWNFNHFVVVEGFHKGKVYINDPAHGRRVLSELEFDEGFTGVVLILKKLPEFEPGGTPNRVTTALRRRFKGLYASVLFIFLVGLMLVVPGLLIPVFTGTFVDKILVGGFEGWLRPLLLGMAITAVLRLAMTWLQSYYLLRMRTHVSISQSSKFFWHVLRLPIEFFIHRSVGDIQNRLAINDRVARVLTGDVAQTVLGMVMIVFFAALMFAYDTTLTLVSIAAVGLNLLTVRFIARRTAETNQKLSLDSGKLTGAAMAGLAAIESIKAAGNETSFFGRWAGYHAQYLNAQQNVARIGLIFGTLPELVTTLNSVLILVIGGLKVMEGQLTLGQLVAFQSLLVSFTTPAKQLVGFANKLHALKGDMDRLDDIVRNPLDPVFATADEDQQPVYRPLDGHVELRNITFGYNRSGTELIADFSVDIGIGRRVAIVGPSGCGKSTMSKLIVGLYQPWRGEILFDGLPRRAFDRHQLSKAIAMVDQDIHLFEGTIRDNLKMWDDTISDENLIAAAQDACIHDVILERTGGYDSLLSEGARNLSGGQRQRLEIARALALSPKVLVLDEATSALDAKTELEIDRNLRRRGCTTIIIAHRLSTIRDADEIIVMNYGVIVERGRHEELLASERGHYRRLVENQ